MLRNIDRKRISQEEIYRYEIRAQLYRTDQKKNKVGGKVWSFVNSAFFLWFLSSVVLGIISFSYAKWDKQNGLEREQRERTALVERENIQIAKKLDAEISSRLNYFFLSQNIYMSVPLYAQTTNSSLTDSEVKELEEADKRIYGLLSEEGIMSLDEPSNTNYKVNVYPEYANRNLRSLLLELKEVVPQKEGHEIALAYEQSIESQSIFLKALKIVRELKKNGKPGYINIDHWSGELKKQKRAPMSATDEWTDLKKFCESFNQERWGKPFPIDIDISIIDR